MNMENFTSVFNSADGPTSIFVAGKTPEIMGVLIAIVVVGVIISLFGLKLVRVLSAMRTFSCFINSSSYTSMLLMSSLPIFNVGS